MIKKYIPLILSILVVAGLSSCRQDDGSPIRNVRFDPNLLSQARDGSSCASYSYFYEGQQKDLGAVFTRQVIVGFAEGTSQAAQKAAMGKYGFVKGISGNPVSAGLYTVTLMDGLNCNQTEQALNILSRDRVVTYAAPYFVQQSNLLGISNEAIVTLSDQNTATLDRLLMAYGARQVRNLSEKVYLVRVDKNAKGNALQLANYLQGQPGILHAEPDFVVSATQHRAAVISGHRAERAAIQ